MAQISRIKSHTQSPLQSIFSLALKGTQLPIKCLLIQAAMPALYGFPVLLGNWGSLAVACSDTYGFGGTPQGLTWSPWQTIMSVLASTWHCIIPVHILFHLILYNTFYPIQNIFQHTWICQVCNVFQLSNLLIFNNILCHKNCLVMNVHVHAMRHANDSCTNTARNMNELNQWNNCISNTIHNLMPSKATEACMVPILVR